MLCAVPYLTNVNQSKTLLYKRKYRSLKFIHNLNSNDHFKKIYISTIILLFVDIAPCRWISELYATIVLFTRKQIPIINIHLSLSHCRKRYYLLNINYYYFLCKYRMNKSGQESVVALHNILCSS